ncbi:MAG TPA: DUF2752 domain-containing protein [Chitinophagales bacterium]|jgi:hypothetical protein|nr:DUF2752 domain-containing protein [Chitinophagales bacterium]MBP6154903.1 DUF2752 domain-containing protein [Chitinophagales bacterium]HQV77593.1 DUF2752 domain-containing protein [Chitinophagales bacterium]HQW79582.1 DUF2752 domain-containing protein [Chitinophagales bacterium]
MNVFKKYYSLELLFLSTSIIYLFFINPYEKHVSICLFKLIGWEQCIGCGLGKSISFLLHGNIQASLQNHLLGTFVLLMFVYRMYQLIKLKQIT